MKYKVILIARMDGEIIGEWECDNRKDALYKKELVNDVIKDYNGNYYTEIEEVK